MPQWMDPSKDSRCSLLSMPREYIVELPESLVASVDALVASGAEKSRAAVLERALLREIRRVRMIEEIHILLTSPRDGYDLAEIITIASRTPLSIP